MVVDPYRILGPPTLPARLLVMRVGFPEREVPEGFVPFRLQQGERRLAGGELMTGSGRAGIAAAWLDDAPAGELTLVLRGGARATFRLP